MTRLCSLSLYTGHEQFNFACGDRSPVVYTLRKSQVAVLSMGKVSQIISAITLNFSNRHIFSDTKCKNTLVTWRKYSCTPPVRSPENTCDHKTQSTFRQCARRHHMRKHVQKTHRDNFHVCTSAVGASQNGGSSRLSEACWLVCFSGI